VILGLRDLLMKKLLCSLAGVVALGLGFQASAGPVVFTIDEVKASVATFSGFGEPDVDPNYDLIGQHADLYAGQTAVFDFFSITFPSIGIGTGKISASLGFKGNYKDAIGSADGSFFSFIVNAGELIWTKQPGLFSLVDGTSYTVLFENLHGITLGKSVDVRAYLTLNSGPNSESVPEPGTLVLLGLGMLGVALVSRRQLAAQRA
jgi:hypothetical protein